MAKHRKKTGHEEVPPGLDEIRELMGQILNEFFQNLDEPTVADLEAFCKARSQFMKVITRMLRKTIN